MESLADTRPLKNNVKFLKPGHHVSCKDGKHMVANTFLSFSRTHWFSHSYNDHMQ